MSQWEQGQGVETAFPVLRRGSARSNYKVCLGCCISEDCEDSEKNRINCVCVCGCVCLHWGAEREREKEMFRNWLMQVVESGRFTSSGHTLRLETQGRVGVTVQVWRQSASAKLLEVGMRSRQDQATSAAKKADFILPLLVNPIHIPPDCRIPGDLLLNNICFCPLTLLSETDWICLLVFFF